MSSPPSASASSSWAAEFPPLRWHEFVDFQAGRARRLFASGLRVERHIPQRAGICVRTMAGLYQRILTEIEANPEMALQRRLSLTPSRKAAVLVRAALPRAPRPVAAGNGAHS